MVDFPCVSSTTCLKQHTVSALYKSSDACTVLVVILIVKFTLVQVYSMVTYIMLQYKFMYASMHVCGACMRARVRALLDTECVRMGGSSECVIALYEYNIIPDLCVVR